MLFHATTSHYQNKQRGGSEKRGESLETQNGSITSNKFYSNIANQNRNKDMFEKKNKSANYEKKRWLGGFAEVSSYSVWNQHLKHKMKFLNMHKLQKYLVNRLVLRSE